MKTEPVAAPARPRRPDTERSRPTPRNAIGLLILAACDGSPRAAEPPSGSTQPLVWALDVDKNADDFLAVVNVDRRSPT